MGCGSSAVVRVAHRVLPPPEYFDEDPVPVVVVPRTLEETVKSEAINIAVEAKGIRVPENAIPVVLLGGACYPLLVANFQVHMETKFQMPVVAISRGTKGKLALFGSVYFLARAVLDNPGMYALLEGLFSWGSSFGTQTVSVLIAGFPQNISKSLSVHLQSLGYSVTVKQELPETVNHDILLVTSDQNCSEVVERHLENDKCVAIFAAKDPEHGKFPSNSITQKYGLAFSNTGLTAMDRSVEMREMDQFNRFTFDYVRNSFLKALGEEETEGKLSTIDTAASELMYWLKEMPNECEEIADLAEQTLQAMKKYGIAEDGKLCPSEVTQILCVVLMEAVKHIPWQLLPQFGYLDEFPGVFEVPYLQEFSLKMTSHGDALTTTGAWLPAGTKGLVRSDVPIRLVIGANITSLLMKKGPWKRWPCVSCIVDVPAGEIKEVSTPFGGIIYVLTDTAKKLQVNLGNVLGYPIWGGRESMKWEKTKNSPVPWCEITCKTSSFVLPRRYISDDFNFIGFHTLYDELLEEVSRFVGAKVLTHRRFVFDIELPNGTPVVEPWNIIVMDMEDIPSILDFERPSREMHRLLTYECFAVIRDAFFDAETELTVAMAVASCVMLMKFRKKELVEEYRGGITGMYDDITKIIIKSGYNVIGAGIRTIITDDNITNTQDAYTRFASIVSGQLDCSMGGVLGHMSMSGRLALECSEKLTEFGITDQDLESAL